MIAIRQTPWTRVTLVTGGTGRTGARVAERLWDQGGSVRLGHRGGVPPFDWTDLRTWRSALDGARAVYLAYQPDIAGPEAAGRVGAFAREAVARGARRLVLLSSRRVPAARLAEDALMSSGADWTILRASVLMQSFTEGPLAPLLAGAAPVLPVGGAWEPFVDASDVADVAVKALLEGGLEGRVLDLTGPRPLSLRTAAAEIAAAVGQPETRLAEASAGLTGEKVGKEAPDPTRLLLPGPLAGLLEGRSMPATTVVADLLGRPARDLRGFATETLDAGARSLAEPSWPRRLEREGR